MNDDARRRELLADLMEAMVADENPGAYIDAELGVFDVRMEMRPEWVAAVQETRSLVAAPAISAWMVWDGGEKNVPIMRTRTGYTVNPEVIPGASNLALELREPGKPTIRKPMTVIYPSIDKVAVGHVRLP